MIDKHARAACSRKREMWRDVVEGGKSVGKDAWTSKEGVCQEHARTETKGEKRSANARKGATRNVTVSDAPRNKNVFVWRFSSIFSATDDRTRKVHNVDITRDVVSSSHDVKFREM